MADLPRGIISEKQSQQACKAGEGKYKLAPKSGGLQRVVRCVFSNRLRLGLRL